MTTNIVRSYYAVDCNYVVNKKNDHYYQIYKVERNRFTNKDEYKFITHRETLKSADKLAKLLAETYTEGFSYGAY